MKAYSTDLRERVIAAWQEGKTQDWIAETYPVSTGSIKRYIRRYQATGTVAATVQRRQEPRISRGYEGALRALVAREPLARLDWYCAAWERETGIVVSIQTMSRMLVRLGLRQKTTVGARERDEVARSDWRERAQTLPARRVVVIDESSTHLDMARRYGRGPRGAQVYVKQRRNYGQNVTLLAGLRLDGMTDSMVIEGAVTTAVFEAFVEHILLPTVQPGDMVVLDNLGAHKSSRVETLLLTHGCQLLFLPAYSPDLSPIEQAFSKIKHFLRTLRAQTLDALIDAIAQALATITPYDAFGFFTDAGFLNLD